MVFEPISSVVLIGIGIALIGIEALLASFFLLWFGIGFIIVGGVHLGVPFSDGAYQIAAATCIAMVLLFVLKAKVKSLFAKNEKEIKDDFLNEAGEGVIKEGMVFYKGTLWEYTPKSLHVKEGMTVKVLATKGNVATIELL